ncbi:hypothetical protein, partial [Actinoplanes sp. NPDC026670]
PQLPAARYTVRVALTNGRVDVLHGLTDDDAHSLEMLITRDYHRTATVHSTTGRHTYRAEQVQTVAVGRETAPAAPAETDAPTTHGMEPADILMHAGRQAQATGNLPDVAGLIEQYAITESQAQALHNLLWTVVLRHPVDQALADRSGGER